MARKVDPVELEREYVTSELSIRELARRHEMSWSAVAQRSRNNNWAEKRAAYRESLNRRAYERTVDRFVAEETEIRTEMVLVARATGRKYLEDLKNGKISVSPKDAIDAVKLLALLLGEPTSRTESRVVDAATGDMDSNELAELIKLARARLVEGPVASGTEPGATTTRPN